MKFLSFYKFFLIIGLILSSGIANAQVAPQLLITWKSQNYQPPTYLGKNFPTQGTVADFSLAMVHNDRLVDLSGYNIRWYQNNRLLEQGVGLTKTSINIQPNGDGNVSIRAAVLNYQQIPEISELISFVVPQPSLAINAPYGNKKIGSGKSVFEAMPYFFNIKSLSDLSFRWLINNEAPTLKTFERPNILELNLPQLPSNYTIFISASASSKTNIETAAEQIELITK